MKCNLCGKEFEVGNREDGIPNGVSFMTKHGMLTVCADCIIDMGKEIEQADTPQTEDLLITEYPQEGEANIVGNGSRTAVVMDYEPKGCCDCKHHTKEGCEYPSAYCVDFGEYEPKQTDCPWK